METTISRLRLHAQQELSPENSVREDSFIFVTFPSFRGRHRGEAFVVKIAASLPSLNLFPAVKEPPPLFEAKTSSGQSDLFNSPLPIKNDPLS